MKVNAQNQSDRRLQLPSQLNCQTFNNKLSQNQKVINFRDIRNSIQQILSGITCCRNCQFPLILTIFANKIQKLRYQRDIVKGRYVDHISELKTQVRLLQEEVFTLRQKLDLQEKERTFITERESYSIETESDDRKNEYQQYLLIRSTIKKNLKEENLEEGPNRKQEVKQKSQSKSRQDTEKQKKRSTSQFDKQAYNSRETERETQSELKEKEKRKCLKSINDIEKIRIKYNISEESVENYLRQYILTEAEQIGEKKNLTSLYEEMIRSKERKTAKESLNYALKSSSNKENSY